MKLLALPAEIQEYPLALTEEKEIRRVSERRLRPLLGQQCIEAGLQWLLGVVR